MYLQYLLTAALHREASGAQGPIVSVPQQFHGVFARLHDRALLTLLYRDVLDRLIGHTRNADLSMRIIGAHNQLAAVGGDANQHTAGDQQRQRSHAHNCGDELTRLRGLRQRLRLLGGRLGGLVNVLRNPVPGRRLRRIAMRALSRLVRECAKLRSCCQRREGLGHFCHTRES